MLVGRIMEHFIQIEVCFDEFSVAGRLSQNRQSEFEKIKLCMYNRGKPFKENKFPPLMLSNINENSYDHTILPCDKIDPQTPRIRPVLSLAEVVFQEMRCPYPLRAHFYALIAFHAQAKFDCFKPPMWYCQCLKCHTER